MTTAEEVIRLFHKAGELAGWKPGVGNPLVINYLTHFAELVKAEENEACIEDVRTVGGMFAVECEALIRARRNDD